MKENQGTLQVGKSQGRRTPNTQNNTRATRNTQDNRNTVQSWVAESTATGRGLEGHLAEYIASETEKKMCTFVKEVQDGTVGPSGGWGEGVAPSPGSEGNSPA